MRHLSVLLDKNLLTQTVYLSIIFVLNSLIKFVQFALLQQNQTGSGGTLKTTVGFCGLNHTFLVGNAAFVLTLSFGNGSGGKERERERD